MDFNDNINHKKSNFEYEKILKQLESLPREELSERLIIDLAEAYTMLSNHHNALNILIPIESSMMMDFQFNYLMGYSYFHINEYTDALYYFRRASTLNTSDLNSLKYLELCYKELSYPTFKTPFRNRVIDILNIFYNVEEELRIPNGYKLLSNADKMIRNKTTKINEIFKTLIPEISVTLDYLDNKTIAIFSPEGSIKLMLMLNYLMDNIDYDLYENWDFKIGIQKTTVSDVIIAGKNVSAKDVILSYVHDIESDSLYMQATSDKFPTLSEENYYYVLWSITSMINQLVGEISFMANVSRFSVSNELNDDETITLDNLPNLFETLDYELDMDSVDYANERNFYTYKYPVEPVDELRNDILYTSTKLPESLDEYNSYSTQIKDFTKNDNNSVDLFHRNGAMLGFYYFSCHDFFDYDEEQFTQNIFKFTEELEEKHHEKLDTLIHFTGISIGMNFVYMDFIAWDFNKVINTSKEIFKKSEVEWAAFSPLRKETSPTFLKNINMDNYYDFVKLRS